MTWICVVATYCVSNVSLLVLVTVFKKLNPWSQYHISICGWWSNRLYISQSTTNGSKTGIKWTVSELDKVSNMLQKGKHGEWFRSVSSRDRINHLRVVLLQISHKCLLLDTHTYSTVRPYLLRRTIPHILLISFFSVHVWWSAYAARAHQPSVGVNHTPEHHVYTR